MPLPQAEIRAMSEAIIAPRPRQEAVPIRPQPELPFHEEEDAAARGLANAVVLALPLWGLISLAVWALL